jgi:Protein of unknown function (DUF2628)
MPVYTVHAPLAATRPGAEATDRFVFVRDGFHVWAFLAGLIWLAYHRLWWGLLGYIAISVVGDVLMSVLHISIGTNFVVMVLFALLMGFEAASLQRWTLSRGKWRQLGYVVADDEESAERRFFDRWTGFSRESSIDRGAPPPTRAMPGQAFSRPPSGSHEGIIGLFPTPGASR